jgi:hypothetical protein
MAAKSAASAVPARTASFMSRGASSRVGFFVSAAATVAAAIITAVATNSARFMGSPALPANTPR